MNDLSSFKDFEYSGFNYEKTRRLPYKEVSGQSYETRIYYDADEDIGCGFEAIVIGYIPTWVPDDNYADNPPFSENGGIILLAHIYAAFDGMRHVYINFDDKYEHYGYINYFDPDEWIELFKELKLLQTEFCRDPA